MKRAVDFLFAAAGLLVLSPVLAFTALTVRLLLGSPVLFRQLRPGLNGKPFVLLKFRTLRDALDGGDTLLPDEARMTPLGQFLRSTSLDELPELWNVLQGEMSLVGPRPLLMEYLPLYTPEQARRHEVRPGITGWAQINGRNAISWEEKFRLDVWYVDHRSLGLDLRILLLTLKKVLEREGISQNGRATMERFTGTAREEQAGNVRKEESGKGKEVAERAGSRSWAAAETTQSPAPTKAGAGFAPFQSRLQSPESGGSGAAGTRSLRSNPQAAVRNPQST